MDVSCDYYQSFDADHGRIETRRYWLTSDIECLGVLVLGQHCGFGMGRVTGGTLIGVLCPGDYGKSGLAWV